MSMTNTRSSQVGGREFLLLSVSSSLREEEGSLDSRSRGNLQGRSKLQASRGPSSISSCRGGWDSCVGLGVCEFPGGNRGSVFVSRHPHCEQFLVLQLCLSHHPHPFSCNYLTKHWLSRQTWVGCFLWSVIGALPGVSTYFSCLPQEE